MKSSLRNVWIILNLCLSYTIYAQTDSSVRLWGLTDCFQYAAAHNIQVNVLKLEQQLAAEDLIAAKGIQSPSLSASIGNIFTNANSNAYGNGSLVNQLTTSGVYAFNSSVVLWNDNAIKNTIKQRDLLNQSAELSVQQSLNNLTLSITAAFLNILLAKENLTYVNDVVSTSEARVKQGQQFYDAGSIAKKDLLQLQATLAGDKYLQVQVQNDIRQNTLTLRQLLQLPVDTTFDVALPATLVLPRMLPSLKEAQSLALNSFPEIKIAKLGIDISELDIRKAKAGFKPVLTASGALGTSYSDVITNSVNSKTNYFTQTGNNFYQRAGLTLSIPIFSNYINKTNLAKANIIFKNAFLNYQNNALVLSQAVEQAYLNASNALQSYNAAEVQLKAASESYRIVNEQFKLGAVNSYDLLQQRNQYIQAIQAFTQAKYSAVLQEKIYEFYMGQPVTL